MELPFKLKSQIGWWLQSPTNSMGSFHPDSIMEYGKICKHDDGHMCRCRIDKLIELMMEFEETTDK